MMHPRVSVVIVSNNRPRSLHRTVLALFQVQYTPFEIVVVADAAGLEALSEFNGQIKTLCFEEMNVAKARNLGISQCAGEIVAFIDDDSVPEPQWLTHLTAPFAEENVALVGGFVIGRNGFSYQWKARYLDKTGFAHDFETDGTNYQIFSPETGHCLKTEGTNMAVRLDVLLILGGFDAAYHFFLDETDLNMRFADLDFDSAIAPKALVHHGFAHSKRRGRDRVPKDLFDIGASWAVFQRKFLPPEQHSKHWQDILREQKNRAIAHMISGGLEPSGVRQLMQSLKRGYKEGQSRQIGGDRLETSGTEFLPIAFVKRAHLQITANVFAAKWGHYRAKKAVLSNKIVTLLIVSRSALYHRLWFDPKGYWIQSGGIWGKSERSQPLFQWQSRKERAMRERGRVQ